MAQKVKTMFCFRFDVDSPCFFTPAIHSRIVQFILDRKKFSDDLNNDFAFGIERLLDEKTYSAGYPLHDVRLTDYVKYSDLWANYTFFTKIYSIIQNKHTIIVNTNKIISN